MHNNTQHGVSLLFVDSVAHNKKHIQLVSSYWIVQPHCDIESVWTQWAPYHQTSEHLKAHSCSSVRPTMYPSIMQFDFHRLPYHIPLNSIVENMWHIMEYDRHLSERHVEGVLSGYHHSTNIEISSWSMCLNIVLDEWSKLVACVWTLNCSRI